jgi:glycosyltransferase involved in cell wall biosynthesis
MAKKILMACIHYWDSPLQVGSHHLARCFVQAGYKVAYVSSPITPMHLFKSFDQGFRERILNCWAGGATHLNGALWAYVPFALIAPDSRQLLQGRSLLRRWAETSLPNIKRKLVSQGFDDVDILYIDSIFQSFWLDAIRFKKSVFRVMDNHLGFPGWGRSLGKITKDIATSVDAVVYSAKTLEPYVRGLKPKRIAYVPNGIDSKFFASGSKAMPASLRGIPRPIAVYAGAMDAWFDFSLLKQASQALPNVAFVLIGPDKWARDKLRGLPNVHLIGPVKHGELSQYLFNSHVGIIPFNVLKYPFLVNTINPLKLYEYMACGLPVVSTEWDELRRIGSPATLCRGANEFIKAVEKAITEPHDKRTFIQYAKEHNWFASFQSLIKAIEDQ